MWPSASATCCWTASARPGSADAPGFAGRPAGKSCRQGGVNSGDPEGVDQHMFRRRYAYADGGPATTTAGPGAAAGARYTIARAIRLIAGLVALVIVAGILLVLLNANMGNQIVSAVHDAAA